MGSPGAEHPSFRPASSDARERNRRIPRSERLALGALHTAASAAMSEIASPWDNLCGYSEGGHLRGFMCWTTLDIKRSSDLCSDMSAMWAKHASSMAAFLQVMWQRQPICLLPGVTLALGLVFGSQGILSAPPTTSEKTARKHEFRDTPESPEPSGSCHVSEVHISSPLLSSLGAMPHFHVGCWQLSVALSTSGPAIW